MRPGPPLGVDELADAVRPRGGALALARRLRMLWARCRGLPFVANDKAPRPPGGADAAIANLHYPDAEQIRAGLDAVLPQAAAGGIPGFEDDAEVEYGWGKENVRLFDYSKPPLFWVFSLAFLGKKALKEIKVRKRYDAAGFFTSRWSTQEFCHQLPSGWVVTSPWPTLFAY